MVFGGRVSGVYVGFSWLFRCALLLSMGRDLDV
jgi:hypothetical protein